MIISVDPGVTHCGITRLTVSDGNLNVLECVNVKGNLKLRGTHGEIEEQFGPRSAKIIRICDTIRSILKKYPEIKDIAVEGPFYNSRRPQAFASLLDVVYGIRYNIAMPKEINMHIVAPMLVKKYWTGKGNCGKTMMYESLLERLKNKEVLLPEDTDVSDLTEHEIDSIAVGYTYLKILEEKNDELIKKNV